MEKEKDNIQTFKKLSFGEFLNLPDDEFHRYESTGYLLKPDNWGVSDILKWDYITVKETQAMFGNGYNYEQLIDLIRTLTGMKREKIIEKTWINVFQFVKFVSNSIDQVNELEKKLDYEPDAMEEKAGIDMFNQFGYFATIDRLAGGDPLKYDDIGKIEYSVIFSKLLLIKTDMQFTKNYQKQIRND